MVYNHSIKVPSQYKRSAKILKIAIEEKKPIRNLVFEEKRKVRSVSAIIKAYSDNRDKIEQLIESSDILKDNPRLDKYLCKVLIAELNFGSKKINCEAKPITTVKSYEQKFHEILGADGNNGGEESKECRKNRKQRRSKSSSSSTSNSSTGSTKGKQSSKDDCKSTNASKSDKYSRDSGYSTFKPKGVLDPSQSYHLTKYTSQRRDTSSRRSASPERVPYFIDSKREKERLENKRRNYEEIRYRSSSRNRSRRSKSYSRRRSSSRSRDRSRGSRHRDRKSSRSRTRRRSRSRESRRRSRSKDRRSSRSRERRRSRSGGRRRSRTSSRDRSRRLYDHGPSSHFEYYPMPAYGPTYGTWVPQPAPPYHPVARFPPMVPYQRFVPPPLEYPPYFPAHRPQRYRQPYSNNFKSKQFNTHWKK